MGWQLGVSGGQVRRLRCSVLKDFVLKIIAVAGARPNYVKIAPLAWQARKRDAVVLQLVNTGQHYDDRLSSIFFRELEIPRPFVDLGVGSGTHAVQTAEVMKRFEPMLVAQQPDLVLVVGDVNSTMACAITAAKLNVPVAHVEAGLRSFDEQMPEEINRIVTDRISRWLFVSEPSGIENLRREGMASESYSFRRQRHDRHAFSMPRPIRSLRRARPSRTSTGAIRIAYAPSAKQC